MFKNGLPGVQFQYTLKLPGCPQPLYPLILSEKFLQLFSGYLLANDLFLVIQHVEGRELYSHRIGPGMGQHKCGDH